jgi:hypothetical protein
MIIAISYKCDKIETPLGTYLLPKLCCMSDCCVLVWLVCAFIVNMHFIYKAHALYISYGLMLSCITCFNFLEHIFFWLGGGINGLPYDYL